MNKLLFPLLLLSTSGFAVIDKCANRVAEFADLSQELVLLINDTERFSSRVGWFDGSSSAIAYATVDWNKRDLELTADRRQLTFRLTTKDLEDGRTILEAAGAAKVGSPSLPIPVGGSSSLQFAIRLDGNPIIIDMANLKDGVPDLLFDLTEDQPHRANNFAGIPIEGLRAAKGPVYSNTSVLEVSPDGLNVLTVQGIGDAYVHDAKTGKLKFSIRADLDYRLANGFKNTLDAKFSSDAKFVVVAHHYGMGSIWDVRSGDLLTGFRTSDSSSYIAPFVTASHHDNLFVVSSVQELDENDHQIRQHNQDFFEIVVDGVETKVRKINSFRNINDELSKKKPKLHWKGWSTPISFGPNKQVIVGTEVGDVYVFDLNKDPTMRKPAVALENGHNGSALSAVTISPDGQFYATGAMDGSVCLWSSHDRGDNYRLVGQELPVKFLNFSDDGTKLLVQGRDTTDTEGPIHPVISRAYVVPIEQLEKKAKEIRE